MVVGSSPTRSIFDVRNIERVTKIKEFKQIPEHPSYYIKNDGTMVIKKCNQNTYYCKNGTFYRKHSKNVHKELNNDTYIEIENQVYRIITLTDNHIGYRFIKLANKNKYVHRLMYETFVGSIPDGMQINHINHKKDDNRLENLELVTASDNQRKARLYHGKKLLPTCLKCGATVKRKHITDYCSRCKPYKNENNWRKIHDRPTKKQLDRLIREHSFVAIGKMYNISDNAVRKWCRTYGLPSRRQDIAKLKIQQ